MFGLIPLNKGQPLAINFNVNSENLFMKKALILTTLLAVSTVTVAKDGERHHGGFNGGNQYSQTQGFFDESTAVKTVAEALKASDDTPAILEGQILKQVGKSEFIFKDSTGEIQIDVSRRAWNGQTISPQDTIQIRGKVDKEWNEIEVDVKQIIRK